MYIIAEIGLNHQGDVELAKKLVDIAVESGVDAVKFQKRSLKHLYRDDVLDDIEKQEFGVQYLFNHIKKSELADEEMAGLHKYSLDRGVDFICTPWEEESLRFLSSLDLPAYKVGSPDMFNLPLLEAMAPLNKPLIMSTGMSFVSEIEYVISFLDKLGVQYILLHCNSTYPSPHYDLNLNFIKVLKKKSKYPVGYSGHEQGIATSLAAVSLGAKVIERHLTLDKNMPGPDHKASLEPEEFKELVKQIRIVEQSLGESVRYVSRGEFLNREFLSKSLVVTKDLKRGEILKREDIGVKSPGHGTKPIKLQYFIGRKLIQRDMLADDYLLESDVDAYQTPDLLGLHINHKWGVVVRMRDIDNLLACGSSFVEVHYTDMDVKSNAIYQKKYDIDLTIHGAEYNGDLLLDLSSLDEITRVRSVDFFNQVLDYSRRLKKLFRNSDQKVKFVIHPGGMNMSHPLVGQIEKLNDNLLDSLNKLNSEGFELLVENMPPFPWYFGGQWHHSSFMDAEEIVEFSRRTGYGIVFDGCEDIISYAKNYFAVH